MKRIAIIGPPGAGKTTLAKELKRIHDIKIYHLDRIFWKRGWKEELREDRIDALQKLVREKQWIIEGFYCSLSKPRLEAADTIIFLDLSPLKCLYRLLKRHYQQRGCSRRDIPLESTDKLDWRLVLRVLSFPLRDRILLKRNLDTYEKIKHIIYLRSPKEVAVFLAQQEQLKIQKQHNKVETRFSRAINENVLLGSK